MHHARRNNTKSCRLKSRVDGTDEVAANGIRFDDRKRPLHSHPHSNSKDPIPAALFAQRAGKGTLRVLFLCRDVMQKGSKRAAKELQWSCNEAD
jgi:hypothetical protein